MEMTYLEAQIVELQTRKVLDRMISTGSGGLCDGLMTVIGVRALGEALRDTDEALVAAGDRIDALEQLCGDAMDALVATERVDENLIDCLGAAFAGMDWSRRRTTERTEQDEASDETAAGYSRADGWDRIMAAVQAQKRHEEPHHHKTDAVREHARELRRLRTLLWGNA
jgi:hypothetical protein